jgi:hypothetical protein
MTSTPIPPAAVPPDDDSKPPVDSAEADRLAAEGEDPAVVEGQEAEQQPSSADADYEASMGEEREND